MVVERNICVIDFILFFFVIKVLKYFSSFSFCRIVRRFILFMEEVIVQGILVLDNVFNYVLRFFIGVFINFNFLEYKVVNCFVS